MLHQVFTVFDSKSQAYLPPFYSPAIGSAIRSFSDSANQVDHPFYQHPEDYCLMHLGIFDDASAKFETLDVPASFGLAHEHIEGYASPNKPKK